MGTRSLTHVYNEDDHCLVTIYRQMDGYPEEHGQKLLDFLTDRVIVNGIGSDTPAKASNGMGCLAASLVAFLKEGIGSIYLEEPGTSDYGENYTYTIKRDGQSGTTLQVLHGEKVLTSGSLKPITEWKEENAL